MHWLKSMPHMNVEIAEELLGDDFKSQKGDSVVVPQMGSLTP